MFKSMPVISAAGLLTTLDILVLYVWEALGPPQLFPHKMAVVWKALGCFLTCLVCCGVVSTPELEGLWMAILKQNSAKVSNHALLECQHLLDVTRPSWCDTPILMWHTHLDVTHPSWCDAPILMWHIHLGVTHPSWCDASILMWHTHLDVKHPSWCDTCGMYTRCSCNESVCSLAGNSLLCWSCHCVPQCLQWTNLRWGTPITHTHSHM